MSKSFYYQQFKQLSADIEISTPLKKWNSKGSTKDYWKKKFEKLQKLLKPEIKIKAKNLKQLTENKHVFTTAEKNKIISEMTAKKQFLKITFDDNNFTLVPMIESNSGKFEGFFENYYKQDEIDIITSDSLKKYALRGIKHMEALTLEANKKMNNKGGKYFKYINTTDIDLTDYQILKNTDDKSIINENCLLYAFKKAGVENSLINQVKLSITKGVHIAKKDLLKISDIIKCKITLHYYRNDNMKIEKTEYGKYNNNINIAIFEDHYFILKDTIYSTYSIKNYDQCKNFENYEDIIKFRANGKPRFEKKKKINSLQLIKILFDNNKFTKKDHTIIEHSQNKNIEIKDIDLSNIEEEQKATVIKQKENHYNVYNFYADTETITNNETDKPHELLLFAFTSDISDDVYHYDIMKDGKYIIKKAFDKICSIVDKKKTEGEETQIILYFHNLKYDHTILREYLHIKKDCKKDGNLYFTSIYHWYKGRKIEIKLKDSYKLINIPLKKFNTTFNLPEELNKKEAINYNYYNQTTIKYKLNSVSKYIKDFTEEEKEIFYNAMNENKERFEYDGKKFNAIKYYKYYLDFDCLLLKKGLKVLNKTLFDITGLNCLDSYTISSFSNKYFKENGCFDGVYECTGNLREYLSNAVRGGRVAVLEEAKNKFIDKQLSDYDACSLYPSAIYRACKEFGMPKGEAKKIKVFTKTELDTFNYYVVTIKIKKINKKQQISFIDMKDENGILQYINEVPESGYITVVDKITLEDYINFHDIEYEILDGVYYNEGFNIKFGEYIEKLYNDRLKYKKQAKSEDQEEASRGQVMQELIKLILNSAYGKTIIKKSSTELLIKPNDEKYHDYIVNNFYNIRETSPINSRQNEIEINTVDKSFNLSIIGIITLSMSKRIMNEVMDVANDNNIKVYYQDTDSMHIERAQIKQLEQEYMIKYNRQLEGKYLCNFHSDFSMKGAQSEIYSIGSYFLGKKSYIDKLESTNDKGEIIHDYHIRLKGITKEGIDDAISRYGGEMKLFKRLAEGKETEFILNPSSKPSFDFTKSGVVTRRQGTFKRVLNKMA